jgi:hypothetical protein
MVDLDGQTEALAEAGGCQHLVEHTGRDRSTVGEQQRVGRRGGDLFEVVGDEDRGRGERARLAVRRGRGVLERGQEGFTTGHVETGCGLVEQQQVGLSGEGARDQHALPLALRARVDRTVGNAVAPESGQQRACRRVGSCLGCFPPR